MKALFTSLVAIMLMSPYLSAAPPANILTQKWEVELPGVLPQSVLVSSKNKNILYAALKNGGLVVFDIGKRPPVPVARIECRQLGQMDVMHLTQHGNRVYLALGDLFKECEPGLAAIDVTNPRRPKVLSYWKCAEKHRGSAVVVVNGKTAFLGAMRAGIMTFDIRNPKSLKHLATFQPDINWPRNKPGSIQHPNARGMALKADRLFLAYDAGGLRVIDVRNPAKPREIGRYINQKMINKQQAYNEIVLDGDRAFIGVDYAGLEIVDVRNPKQIRQVGWWNPWKADSFTNLWLNSPGHINQLQFDRKRKWLYMSGGDAELQVVDVSSNSPKLVGRFGDRKNKRAAWGLTLSDGMVYLTYIKAAFPFQGQWAGIKAVNAE